MATKTTSTTDNNAGCSPCTPEAHQRAKKLLAEFDKWGRSGRGRGVKDAANLAATVKRTSSAIQSIQYSPARVILSEQETATLDEAMRVLSSLGSEIQTVKKQAIKANEEWTTRRAKLLAEAAAAVDKLFPLPGDVDGAVVILAWGKGDHRFGWSTGGIYWRTDIKKELEADEALFWHKPDVMAKVKDLHRVLLVDMASQIVSWAEDRNQTVPEVVAKLAADLESKRADLAEENRAFIDQIKTVAVAQRLAKTAN